MTIEKTATRTLPEGVSAEDFAKALANPSSVSTGEISISNHSVRELIALDEHFRKYGRAHAKRRRHPLSGMVTHLVPPGTCDR